MEPAPADEELASLEARCFAAPWPAAAYAAFRENPRVGAWTLRAGEGAVAFILFQEVGEEAEIFRIGVLPEHRRRGRGAELLGKYLEHAAGRGVGRVFLEVRAGNRAAARLYETAGFRLAGKRKGYFSGPGEDALIYELPLAPPARGGGR